MIGGKMKRRADGGEVLVGYLSDYSQEVVIGHFWERITSYN
jgi:hypothetical protein